MFLGPVGDDPQSAEVKRLGIRPGDRLVIRLDHDVCDEEAEAIRAAVCQSFEDSGYIPPVLILGIGMEIGVIGPDEAP